MYGLWVSFFFVSVVEPSKTAWKKIRKEFGESVFHNDGTLNRQALGQVIFTNPEKRLLLNSITHPEIYKSILRKCVRLFFTGIFLYRSITSLNCWSLLLYVIEISEDIIWINECF